MISTRSRDWTWTKYRVLAVIIVVGAIVAFARGAGAFQIAVAAVATYGIFWVGWAILGSFARPVPAPLPSGELRRVRLQYRCSVCGAEVRMTAAPDETPEPPRHCLEDMEEVAPLYE